MKKLTTIVVMLLLNSYLFGQIEQATTISGKKVLLNPDGTWKYAEIKDDSIKTTFSDCSNWIKTETDKLTGITSTDTKKTLLVSTDGGKKGLGIALMQGSRSELIMLIRAVGASSCIDEGRVFL